jgi:hypothetical protein
VRSQRASLVNDSNAGMTASVSSSMLLICRGTRPAGARDPLRRGDQQVRDAGSDLVDELGARPALLRQAGRVDGDGDEFDGTIGRQLRFDGVHGDDLSGVDQEAVLRPPDDEGR